MNLWNGRLAFAICFCLLSPNVRTVAQLGETSPAHAVRTHDPAPTPFYSGPVARTEHIADDASLNDVCGIGSDCWAVGERGVIVRSNDAGATWKTALVPAECSLTSVCFLTNQIGFVAGSRFDAFQKQHVGVLLTTRDGGESWTVVGAPLSNGDANVGTAIGVIPADSLPPISFVKYFDLQHAVAIAMPDVANSGSLVLRTADGGRTWNALSSEQNSTRWQSAAFFSPNDGIVVGLGDAAGSVVGDRVITLRQPQRTLRRRRDTSLSSDGSGWMVGDGGLLRTTMDGGVTWPPPVGRLAPALNDVFDYRTVDHDGLNVCVAGSPGSVVLHSADGGASWKFRQLTSSAPINRIRFVGKSTVLAVGAFGVIQRSNDAGLTWSATRNGNYRAAVLCLATDVNDTSFRMLTDISGDQGFRSVVVQPSASLPREGIDDSVAADRLRIALPMAGANVFSQDWMFSRTQPMQHQVQPELLKTWGMQTDGRLTEILPQRLAQLIRIWRPDAICIDRSSETDEVAKIWLQALEPATAIAAGANPRGAILDQVGLRKWSVSRTVVKLTGADTSPLNFAGDSLLENLGTTSDLVAEYCEAAAELSDAIDADSAANQSTTVAYAVIENGQAAATPSHLLAAVMHTPGSDARRRTALISPEQQEQWQQIAQQDRTKRAALKGHLASAETPLSLIADLQTLGRNLPARLALQQLQHLASLYESLENLEGQIAVLREITRRFPEAPESADAAELLFQFYSSEELRFLRRREGDTSLLVDREDFGQQALERIPGISVTSSATLQHDNNSVPRNGLVLQADERLGQGVRLPKSNGRATAAIDEAWDRNADAALRLLYTLAPNRATSPRTLLRHAANVRRRGTLGDNSTVLSKAAAGDGLYALLARAELQSTHGANQTPVPVINLPKILSKPVLDGDITELCWQEAFELHLADKSDSSDAKSDCLIMLAWDEDHLYVAGRIELLDGHSNQLDKSIARHHDTDHKLRDRVKISFDADRDFTSAYEFTIDEAGQTSERCWRATSWNPEWFVAEQADETVWRFELAIPQTELRQLPISAGDLWAIRIQRLVPGVLEQSLVNPDPDAGNDSTQGFGLLRFIRNRHQR